MIKNLTDKYRQWNYLRKSKKVQDYSYKGIDLKIFPGVFSPIGTVTTELFVDFLLEYEWKDKKVLELGAGCGIVSFVLTREGAEVTASDISQNAVKGLLENRNQLGHEVNVVNTDYFDGLDNRFDIILINPPFFNKEPKNITEKAWYCGKNYDFFEELFSQFFKRNGEEMWMILSEKTDITRIKSIAERHKTQFLKMNSINDAKEVHHVLFFKN